MTAPVRLRLSRARGFDLQAHSRAVNGLAAVKVDRSTGFGNPFPINKAVELTRDGEKAIWSVGTWTGPAMWFKSTRAEAQTLSVDAYRAWIGASQQRQVRARAEILRGKNLACWCAIGSPCHADVLLEIANRPICEAVDEQRSVAAREGCGND